MATIKLFESWLKEQLTESLKDGQSIESALAEVQLTEEEKSYFDPSNKDAFDSAYAAQAKKIEQYFKDKGIKFSVDTLTVAQKLAAYPKRMRTIGEGSTFKLMDHPEDPTKVLTTGKILPYSIENPQDKSEASNYEDIILYNNNAQLLRFLGVDLTWDKYREGIKLQTDANGSAYFIEVATAFLLGTVATQAAQAKQEVATITWEIPAEGKVLVKNLPGTMFATGEVTLADPAPLDGAINELNALLADKQTKITKIEIQSSASGDRGVGGVSGYPANTPAGKYPLGTPYMPKAATESGNAKLAFGRAETIKAKLAGLSAPITITPMIQDGGDAAQYAKIIATIEKVDKPGQVLSKQEISTLISKPKNVTDLASTKSVFRINIAFD